MTMRYAACLVAGLMTAAASAQSVPRATPLGVPNASLDAEFTQVTSVRELGDGRLLVIDGLERALKVVDWSKGTATLVGRNGAGPGEYQQPSALLATRGDTTILLDPRNGRWLLLHGAQIVGTVSSDAPALRAGTRAPLGADLRGNVIALKAASTGPVTPSSMPRRDSVVLLRLARGTGAADTLAMLRARPTVIRVAGPANQPTSVSVFTHPLAAGETAALFPDGWIAMARLDPYRVEWVSPEGQHTRGPNLPYEPIRLDEREQRAFLLRESERTGRSPREPNALPEWPQVLPPFQMDALLAAPDGRLWIRRPPSADHVNPPYDVIDRQGVLVGRVQLENNVHVAGFGRNVVYTVATDDSGIQRLQRRPLPGFGGAVR